MLAQCIGSESRPVTRLSHFSSNAGEIESRGPCADARKGGGALTSKLLKATGGDRRSDDLTIPASYPCARGRLLCVMSGPRLDCGRSNSAQEKANRQESAAERSG